MTETKIPPRNRQMTRMTMKPVHHGADIEISIRKLDECGGEDLAYSLTYCLLLICKEYRLDLHAILVDSVQIAQRTDTKISRTKISKDDA